MLLPGIAGELPNKKLLCGLIGRLFLPNVWSEPLSHFLNKADAAI